MCTVSIIRTDEAIRIACNRDEQRTRPPALPPTVREMKGTRAIMPIDAHAGGTWIAVNEFGVAMTLLNMNRSSCTTRANATSRGAIIPSLLHASTPQEAVELLSKQTLTPFNPFRLILIDIDQTIECQYDGRTLSTHANRRLTSQMFTSSGLGDDAVDSPRRKLFAEMLANPTARNQDAFHCHSWDVKNALSVCMRRPDAMTVSHTIIDLSQADASMVYHDGPPDQTGHTAVVSLPICKLSAA